MRKKFGDKNFLSPRPLFGHALKIFLAQNNHMTYQIGREFNADIEFEIIFQIQLIFFEIIKKNLF